MNLLIRVLTDAIVNVVDSCSELQTGRLVSLTEDASLHVGGEVVGSPRRRVGAGVIATYPHQPRVYDIIRDQVLSEEDKPELVVGLSLGRREGMRVVCSVGAHKCDGETQPVIVGAYGTKQLCRLQRGGVRGRCQGDVLVGDAELSCDSRVATSEESS